MLSAKQGGNGTGPIFRVFGMTRPGIKPQPSSLKADTLTLVVLVSSVSMAKRILIQKFNTRDPILKMF